MFRDLAFYALRYYEQDFPGTRKVERRARNEARSRGSVAGFSLLEMLIVVAIVIALAAFVIPNLMRGARTWRLRGAGTDFAGLLQQTRLRAVQDNRFYSVYLLAGTPQQEFIDIYPQRANGTSGTGGTAINPGDPAVALHSEISQQPQAAAPNTADLKTQFMGANPAGAVVYDASTLVSPVTFGPLGLPCKPTNVTGGTVCRGGPLAYWVFFENNASQQWEAVTVTPAGRIQRWVYSADNGTWAKL
jgi:Tfp pilus assembly protein FimT